MKATALVKPLKRFLTVSIAFEDEKIVYLWSLSLLNGTEKSSEARRTPPIGSSHMGYSQSIKRLQAIEPLLLFVLAGQAFWKGCLNP
jgi:hypothetical protein